MSKITVDLQKPVGPMKPMHAVNNGPIHKFGAHQRISNLDAFIEAGIPYARNHDASFNANYGGNHTVDVNFIFTNWDADPTDPASYDFACTDYYMKVHEAAGLKPFYRLGTRIEHEVKKYNTLPPKDFKKWAVICEHIIRHYNEGWADGMHMGIEYWEIWNEASSEEDDAEPIKKCSWGGTAAEFYEFFRVAYTHLKEKFPHLKIGGPAVNTLFHRGAWVDGYFKALGDLRPDFFSWHCYGADIPKMKKAIHLAKDFLDRWGHTGVESILNEWNYVKGWDGDAFVESLRTIKSLKGAAFVAATMLMSQYEPVDMLMYYDARPSAWNCLFSTDMVSDKLKGYYPFYMFNQLYRQKTAVAVESDDEDVYAAAAAGDEQAVMLTYYSDDDTMPEKTVTVELCGTAAGRRLEVYRLDDKYNADLCFGEPVTGESHTVTLRMPLYTTALLKIVKE
ncbi:MAG: hypothetical protein IJF73_02980 [Clostridia bacterium]|nr:hypothetical protein [Clostridia bacterium]